MNYKELHIGSLIEKMVRDMDVDIERICNYFKCGEDVIADMYVTKSLDLDTLLKWAKLLDYDFFRLYSHHLLLYASTTQQNTTDRNCRNISLPVFRKNLYTTEIIQFVLRQIREDKMSIKDVIERYRIPKTTIYRWINKYESV